MALPTMSTKREMRGCRRVRLDDKNPSISPVCTIFCMRSIGNNSSSTGATMTMYSGFEFLEL